MTKSEFKTNIMIKFVKTLKKLNAAEIHHVLRGGLVVE